MLIIPYISQRALPSQDFYSDWYNAVVLWEDMILLTEEYLRLSKQCNFLFEFSVRFSDLVGLYFICSILKMEKNEDKICYKIGQIHYSQADPVAL